MIVVKVSSFYLNFLFLGTLFAGGGVPSKCSHRVCSVQGQTFHWDLDCSNHIYDSSHVGWCVEVIQLCIFFFFIRINKIKGDTSGVSQPIYRNHKKTTYLSFMVGTKQP